MKAALVGCAGRGVGGMNSVFTFGGSAAAGAAGTVWAGCAGFGAGGWATGWRSGTEVGAGRLAGWLTAGTGGGGAAVGTDA